MPENNRPDYWVDAPDHASYQDSQEWESYIPLSGKNKIHYRCFTEEGLAKHNTKVSIVALKEIADNIQPGEVINQAWLYDLIKVLEEQDD